MRCGLYCMKTGNSIPLKKIKIQAEIGACISHVQSKLVYFNDSDNAVEANFTFPLDDESAVYKFEAVIDGRTIVSEVQERNQARETYTDAVQSGKTAILLEEHSDTGDIFTCRLGNLPGKEPATITISHVSELPHDPDGALRFTLPTVLNPRYGKETPPLQPAMGLFGQTMSTGGMVCINPGSYTLILDLDIQSPTKIMEVFSESDKITVDYQNDRASAHVHMEFGDNAYLDHDISILYKYEDMHRPQAIVERGLKTGDSGIMKSDVVMMDFYPKFSEKLQSNGEYIFIVDRSGSMDCEDRMEHARETLILMLKSLPVGCHFNIFSFGNYYHVLFDQGSPKYSQESLNFALNFVQNMQADMGGTEILKPLQDMYARLSIPGHPKQVFLLTDGQVYNVKEICDLVTKNAMTTRVFSVGIGEGASTSLVKGLARAGNGKAVFVKGSDRLQQKVLSLLKCAMQPIVTDVHVVWDLPPLVTALNVPKRVPNIFFGEKIILYAVINGSEDMDAIAGTLILKGQVEDKLFEHQLAFRGQGQENNSDASLPVHRLASKSLIQELEDSENQNSGLPLNVEDAIDKPRIISISTSSNVISKYTSFVGVDKESKVEIKILPYQMPTFTFGSAPAQVQQPGGFGFSHPVNSGFAFGSTAPQTMGGGGFFGSKSTGAGLFGSSTGSSGFGGGGGMFGAHPSGSQPSFGMGGVSSAQPLFGAPVPFGYGSNNQSTTFTFGAGPPQQSQQSTFGSSSTPVTGYFGGQQQQSTFGSSSTPVTGYFGAKPIPTSSEFKRTQPKQNEIVNLVMLQSFDGYWELNHTLAVAVSTDLSKLQRSSPMPNNETIWATAVAIAWLKVTYPKSKAEWEMIETKARVWLNNQGLVDDDINTLVTTAETVLTGP